MDLDDCRSIVTLEVLSLDLESYPCCETSNQFKNISNGVHEFGTSELDLKDQLLSYFIAIIPYQINPNHLIVFVYCSSTNIFDVYRDIAELILSFA